MTRLDQAKRTLIIEALAAHGWGQTGKVAAEIGISKPTLVNWIGRYRVTHEEVTEAAMNLATALRAALVSA